MKDIVVHLTGSAEDEVRLGCAESLAAKFDAHLTGVLVQLRPEFFAVPDATVAAVLQDLVDEAENAGKERRARLGERFARMAVPNDLRVVAGYQAEIGDQIAAEARTADLYLGTRPYGAPAKDHQIEEAVLFGSGRACLWLPPKKTAPSSFDTVLVAWKDTRESARAVKEALPFLKTAKQVIVALVTDEPSEASKSAGGGDIARYLSRHGIKVEVRELSGWRSAAEAIFNEATRCGVDMIVAGAYGRSRLQQRLLGGVTRSLLSEADLPVLTAR